MLAPNYPSFPDRGIHRFMARYLRGLPDLTGKVVVDIPCGDGRASAVSHSKHATVRALDLFPEFMRVPGMQAGYADMNEPLPLPDASADIVICQEGIEHVQDQLHLLEEFNRILKPGATLVLTTPNASHMRARLSWLFFESDSWRRLPLNELEAVWRAGSDTGQIYFGHLFLCGVQRLQTLTALAGFRVRERRRTEVALASVISGVVLYPLLVLANLLTIAMHGRKQQAIAGDRHRRRWREQVRLNLAPTTLFCKHILWVLEKEATVPVRRRELIKRGPAPAVGR
jgi:SAM-dependent methyltransferase